MLRRHRGEPGPPWRGARFRGRTLWARARWSNAPLGAGGGQKGLPQILPPFNGNSRILKWSYYSFSKAIFCVDIPVLRPETCCWGSFEARVFPRDNDESLLCLKAMLGKGMQQSHQFAQLWDLDHLRYIKRKLIWWIARFASLVEENRGRHTHTHILYIYIYHKQKYIHVHNMDRWMYG